MNERISPAEWHGWHLEPATPSLTFETEEFNRYEIDLHRMLDASDILSWIMQLHHKKWGAEVVTGLVTAVDDVLAPQQRICAFRGPNSSRPDETPYTPESLRERVDEFVASWPARVQRRFEEADPVGYSGHDPLIRNWHKVIEADPRVKQLAETAYDLIRAGDQERSAPAVYGDTKAYLEVLVGWRRGREVGEGRRFRVDELPAAMQPIVDLPYVGPAEAEEFLRSSAAWDAACEEIDTKLYRIYEELWVRR